ncbi:ribonuclease-like protein p/mrp subunit [Xylaria bambusicola]|uniref:ribonuclease-like protein p/mrp subunit n=1 Tax=Xylaria bambusicola TaxID=326684 RepID=UPI0020078C4D|nr:ribonuclease-like protein p/mrp subunit [Xylaria bambusicola]KAI0502713.1 ribonuclease-like protein p/mrp subunit [Xylaria bambusicola]
MRRSSSFFSGLQRVHSRSKSDDTTRTSGVNHHEGAALTVVYQGDNPEIDIIAVHGINGDAVHTFSSKSNNRFWLSDDDMLPRDVKNARIMTYSYPASVTALLGGTSSDRILQHAQTMIAELVADRELEHATERPIIFICHSLGGIVVKRALVYSASRTASHIKHLRSIYVSTYGMLFFGTPHQGSRKANLLTPAQRIIDILLPSRILDTEAQLLNALKEGSEILQEITDNFAPLMKDFRVYFFWEQEKTDLGFKLDYIVSESSAAPIIDNTDRAGIRADHRSMCRFTSRNAPGYTLVASSLLRYARDAPQTISRRWRNEKDIFFSSRQQQLKHSEYHELESESEEVQRAVKS